MPPAPDQTSDGRPPEPSRPGGPLLRARHWLRRNPLVADAVLAALVFVPAGAQFNEGPPTYEFSFATQLAGVLPLVWRRRSPILVFVWVAAFTLVLLLVNGDHPGPNLPLLVALYTVGAYEPLRRLLICALAIEAGAIAALVAVESSEEFWRAAIGFTVELAIAGVLGIYFRTRRAYLTALEDRADRLERDRDQQYRIAVIEERGRIAREMHDIVAHNLSVMIALADGAVFANRADPAQGQAIMEQVATTGRQALDEMRRVLGMLREGDARTELAPQPAIDDLDSLLTAVRKAGLQTRLTVSGTSFPIRASGQLAIYRLVQEALTNTLKHARATAADVHLHYGEDRTVEVVVTDNGIGASGDGAAQGHGLTGMRERAALFGGTVQAGPMEHGGWRVSAVLQTEGTDATT
ncbi:MAG TPA: sensor histidine kinase [Micromonosporaceae bacterium]|nr:sensor histidine kinase [Micromonosporaceae bacterium]